MKKYIITVVSIILVLLVFDWLYFYEGMYFYFGKEKRELKELLNSIILDADAEVCIITAYWHDVGRTKIQEGHEKMSVHMLVETMRKMNYDEEFIKRCSDSIEFHKWNMTPKTIEGLVVKDADKIAWLGSGRWKSCINKRQRIDSIVELLPKLRNEILHFDYSKKLYDEEIINVLKILYSEIYKEIS